MAEERAPRATCAACQRRIAPAQAGNLVVLETRTGASLADAGAGGQINGRLLFHTRCWPGWARTRLWPHVPPGLSI